MSLSNKRKAGAPSIERSAKVPRTALGMEDSNSQISMAALFRANKLVHDLKESQLRTILVQAYVSHPEIAHVVDLEHAKINETLSEPDAEPDPAPDSASDSEPDHVAGDHAREGSDNDMSASEDEMTKRNRKITELKRRDISESFSCSCKDGCANGRCECSKNSFSCGPDCKCTSCANYLNQLALFFGEQRLRATNCFASWMKAQGPDLDLDSAYTQEELRSTIMGVDEKKYYDKPEGSIFNDGSDEEIQELGKTWLKAKTEAQRKPIRMVLFKKAFLEDGVHFFSFCSGAWEESHSTDHCPICDECNDWRDWHCMDCGKCQFGISIPCEGCGGVSNAYHGQLESL